MQTSFSHQHLVALMVILGLCLAPVAHLFAEESTDPASEGTAPTTELEENSENKEEDLAVPETESNNTSSEEEATNDESTDDAQGEQNEETNNSTQKATTSSSDANTPDEEHLKAAENEDTLASTTPSKTSSSTDSDRTLAASTTSSTSSPKSVLTNASTSSATSSSQTFTSSSTNTTTTALKSTSTSPLQSALNSTTSSSSSDSSGNSQTLNTTSQTGASTTITDTLTTSGTATATTLTAGVTSTQKENQSSAADSSTLSPAETTATSNSITNATNTPSQNVTSTSSTTKISTGDAVVTANLVNLVNTNLVNSDGAVVFLDLYSDMFDTIDLRNALSTDSAITCSFLSCNVGETTIMIANDANIDNNLYLIARTGSNEIDGAGNAVIASGDAYANANIVNVANMNIIDSQYLFAIINAFAHMRGDIVFPSLTSYLSNLAGFGGNAHLKNDATVNNNVTVDAETGNNDINGAKQSTTTTGTAGTGASIYNQVNTSLIGGESVSILFRMGGNWSGEVFGLPDNASWIKTDTGYVLRIDPISGSDSGRSTDTNVYATNTARINNTVVVSAETGNNRISGAESALISTGDAYAGANLVNIANGNVIGRNWMMAIVNIFGDFTGNISFGRPDLWIGGVVALGNKPKNGDVVTYKYTVTNKGDAPANQVTIADKYSAFTAPISATDNSYRNNESARTISWEIDRLEPGETAEVSYQATIVDVDERHEVSNTVTVREREPDNNYDDNTEVLRFFAGVLRSGGTRSSGGDSVRDGSEPAKTSPLSIIEVNRTPRETIMSETQNVTTQTLTLYNPTNKKVPNVILSDTLEAANGTILSREEWKLGDILPHEELTITYALAFKPNTPAGTYTFTSRFTSNDDIRVIAGNGSVVFKKIATPTVDSAEIVSAVATAPTPVTFSGPAVRPMVRGTSTTASSSEPHRFLPVAHAAEISNTESIDER